MSRKQPNPPPPIGQRPPPPPAPPLPPVRSEPLLADAGIALRALCASPVVIGMAARIRDDAAKRNDKVVYDIACELIRSKANTVRGAAEPRTLDGLVGCSDSEKQ